MISAGVTGGTLEGMFSALIVFSAPIGSVASPSSAGALEGASEPVRAGS